MRAGAISTPLTNLSHLPRMVSRARLKSILTGLALYAMAAAIVGYFGVNAYTGKYGLNARQELDQEIVALTSELAQLKRERARSEQRVSLLRSAKIDPDMLDERARASSSTTSIRAISSGRSRRTDTRAAQAPFAGFAVCR
ncbi:cell division protein FtsB [Bradyrhizobium sp. GM7.3]